MNKFTINPSTNMMDVLAYSGYTFDSAIADIIDNSISAHANNIFIKFEIKNDKVNVLILDDGDGMNLAKLRECMIPAYRDLNEIRSNDDLGRYSLGLKSASKSFCKQLFVSSKTGNNDTHTVEIDFEYIKNNNVWEAFELDSFDYANEITGSGTLVYWQDVSFKSINKIVDKQYIYETFEKLEESLSHVFGRYILEDGLKIYIQNFSSKSKHIDHIKGWDPFFLPNNKGTMNISNKEILFNGNKISFSTFILPTFGNLKPNDQKYMLGRGLIEQSGFYVYRNKRLIQEGGWLSLPNIKIDSKCIYARIEVNIGTFLDKEFNVNFSKSKIEVPPELVQVFSEVANYARNQSRKSYDYVNNPSVKNKIKKEKNVNVWEVYNTTEGCKLKININHPVINEIFSKLTDNDRNKICNLLTKTLPIAKLQTIGVMDEKYALSDIQELIKSTYNELLKHTPNVEEIKKKMFKTEPFIYYTNELIDFFGKLESDKYE